MQGLLFAVDYFVFFFLGPAFLINRALLNRKTKSKEISWYPSSFLLRDFMLFSEFIMLLALIAYIYLTQGQDTFTLVKIILNTIDPEHQLRDMEPFFIKVFPFLPGLFAFSLGALIILNAILAQGLLVRFKRNLRPTPSLENLQVPNSFLIIFGLAIILSLIGVGSIEVLGKSMAFVLTFPFFLVGLGMIHRMLRKTSFVILGLTLFYVILLLLLWPALFVILLGMLKPWIEKTTPPN
jgi:hypothetical protein